MEQTHSEQMDEQLTQQIDNFVKSIENDVQNSKTLTDIDYKKKCLSVCRQTRNEIYQIQLDLVQEKKSNIKKALALPESDRKRRQELYESWEMVFDSMIERCNQVGGPIQLLLQNICENNAEFKGKYSPLLILRSGAIIVFLGLTVLSPVSPVIPSLSPWLATIGIGNGATAVIAATAAAAVIYSGCRASSSTKDEAFVVDKSMVIEFEQKLNELVNTCKTEEHVWFSNELLENLLNGLEGSEERLENYKQ